MIEWIVGGIVVVGLIGVANSIKIVRPTERFLKERLGKRQAYLKPGLQFFIPGANVHKRVSMDELHQIFRYHSILLVCWAVLQEPLWRLCIGIFRRPPLKFPS